MRRLLFELLELDTSGVTDPAPQTVYQTYRYYYNFSYALDSLTPGAIYALWLHFADPTFDSPGQWKFNVSVIGAQVLTNFDIATAAGGRDKAVVTSVPFCVLRFVDAAIGFSSLLTLSNRGQSLARIRFPGANGPSLKIRPCLGRENPNGAFSFDLCP